MLHPSHETKSDSFETPKFGSIIEIRLRLDAFMNSIPHLRGSREVSLVATSLQRSFMWLGEALKASGSQSPYLKSEDPTNPEIEPQAQKTTDSLLDRWSLIEETQTARVKDFRFCLSECISGFKLYRSTSESAGKEYEACLDQSWYALKEAKLWFGWELNSIKKQKEWEANGQPTSPGRMLPL